MPVNGYMYRKRIHRCDHRIVSISQPHVRPIVRGKASKKVEFGAKIGVSLAGNRLAHIDHLGWEAFHEGHDLPAQVEAYKDFHGYYPEVVLGDTLYGSRENRICLADRHIRFAGKALGRPKKKLKRIASSFVQQLAGDGPNIGSGFPLKESLDKVKTVTV